MTISTPTADRVLRWIGDLDHPFYNDERQRFVWYEGSTIGFQLLLLAQLTLGPLVALFALQANKPLLAFIGAPTLLAAVVVIAYSSAKGAPYVAGSRDLRRPRTYLLVIPAVLFAIVVAGLGSGGDLAADAPAAPGGGNTFLAVVLVVAFVVGIGAGVLASQRKTGDRDEFAAGPAMRPADLSMLDRGLRWLGDLDHPFYNDERQRFVWYEASAIGFQLILVLQLAASGLVMLVLGRDAVPAVFVGLIPAVWVSAVVVGYAKRRGAQYFPRMSDVKRSRSLLAVALLAIYFAAMVRLSLDTSAEAGSFDSGFASGMPAGFAVGIIAVVVTAWRGNRRQESVEDVD